MQRVAVAASGGRDSTALLHCSARMAREHGIEVLALHVHHGLMPQADAWQRQVQAQARRWGAGFASQRLQGSPQQGDSVEAWARRGRHAALSALAKEAGAGLLLLAHHRRDQAETWLLQALRGGGPRGLAAMPRLAQRDGVVWARPWLDMPREAIDAYVQRHRLRCAEDASNANPRFARSRLRTAVWPALVAAFGDAETALVGAAAQARQAAALADEVAAADLPALCSGQGLDQQAWLRMTAARRLNALRAWLAARLPHGVPHTLLQRLAQELPQARAARWPAGGGQTLQLYRGVLALAPRATDGGASAGAALDGAPRTLRVLPEHAEPCPEPDSATHDFSRVGVHVLRAWGGQLHVSEARAGGIAVEALQAASLRQRAGGERFQRHAGGLPRSLKLQFQAAAVPAWQRQAPLLFAADGRLLFVPGLGADARCLAPPGAPQRLLRWLAGPAA